MKKIDLDTIFEDWDDSEDDDYFFKVGDIIKVKPGIKSLNSSKYIKGANISPDDPYEPYEVTRMSGLSMECEKYRVVSISHKKDGTEVIKISGNYLTFWCWFYADEWELKK